MSRTEPDRPVEPPVALLPRLEGVDAAEYLISRGGWHFTRQLGMDESDIDDFYTLYALAFDPLRVLSVVRQVLTRDEFTEQMLNREVEKYVAWNDAAEPLGLATLTRRLETVPWINPEYFAAHFPDYWSRNAVHYLGFTLAHPSQRHQRFLETLVTVGLTGLAEERALVAYDICGHNYSLIRFDERIAAVLTDLPGARVRKLDAQFYSCFTFA